MKPEKLTRSQQLLVVQELARLAYLEREPVGGLLAVQSDASGKLRMAVQAVAGRIDSGQTLASAVAGDSSRHSQILRAAITSGERGNCLAHTLESWISTEKANIRSSKALQAALVYPIAMLLTMLLSLSFVIWLIVPEYRATYELFDQELPGWLQTLEKAYTLRVPIMCCAVTATLAPVVWWLLLRASYDRQGQPRDIVKKLRLQAMTSDWAAKMLQANVPLDAVVTLAVEGTGATEQASSSAFTELQQRQPVDCLAPPTSMVLAALHAGVMQRDQTIDHLSQVASQLRATADLKAIQQSRWIPMLAAFAVGFVTLFLYVVMIYGPWILLLKRITAPL